MEFRVLRVVVKNRKPQGWRMIWKGSDLDQLAKRFPNLNGSDVLQKRRQGERTVSTLFQYRVRADHWENMPDPRPPLWPKC